MITPARATVMADLKKRVQGLLHMDSLIKAVEEKFNAQESSIEQRLKWAAGANPALNPVLQNFEQTLAARKKLMTVSSQCCSLPVNNYPALDSEPTLCFYQCVYTTFFFVRLVILQTYLEEDLAFFV